MNRSGNFLAATLASLLFCASEPAPPQIASYFSPRGGCQTATIQQIDAANTSIDAAEYILTAAPLGAALERAKARGVRVRVVIDRAQEAAPSTYPKHLKTSGLEIRTDKWEKLQHNKYAVIDGKTVLTGSFNWSDNAENANAENLLVIQDPATIAAFGRDFQKHWDHSQPFVVRPRKPSHRDTPRAIPPFPNTSPTQKGS